MASKCNVGDFQGVSPGHEYGPLASPILCSDTTSGCIQAAQRELGCNSAPSQPACVPVGLDVDQKILGQNPITQYRPNLNVIVNGTSETHRYHDGMVIRWVGVDSNGDVRIWTYGVGKNTSTYMGLENRIGGRVLFEKIGIENAINVRRSLKQ